MTRKMTPYQTSDNCVPHAIPFEVDEARSRDETFDSSSEDCRPNTPSPALRDQGSASGQAVCHRRTGRQATSAVAYTGSTPDADDPLLTFAPYIHPHPRSNSITPERQRRFVATLAATGIVTQAARKSSFCLPLRYMRRRGKSMEALYKLRARPGAEGFAAAWDAALERGMQRLEDCARFLCGLPLRYLRPIARAQDRSQALRLFAP